LKGWEQEEPEKAVRPIETHHHVKEKTVRLAVELTAL
jgi:hypothetical protein